MARLVLFVVVVVVVADVDVAKMAIILLMTDLVVVLAAEEETATRRRRRKRSSVMLRCLAQVTLHQTPVVSPCLLEKQRRQAGDQKKYNTDCCGSTSVHEWQS
jgi:hypothetical protein